MGNYYSGYMVAVNGILYHGSMGISLEIANFFLTIDIACNCILKVYFNSYLII